jgi:hypothetical protein
MHINPACPLGPGGADVDLGGLMKNTQVNFRCDPIILAILERAAKAHGEGKSVMIRRILREWFILKGLIK